MSHGVPFVGLPGIIPRETKFQAGNPTYIAMTIEQYEDVYRETLRCLSEQYSVDEPSMDASGNRVCRIEGVPLNDDEVLERWWGAEIRDDIRRQYPSKKGRASGVSTSGQT
jgi:hypothetical protein